MAPKKHIFVVGLDQFNLEMLERLPSGQECEFHAALDISDIRDVERFDMEFLIDKAVRTIEQHPGEPSGVCSFYDFPGTDLVPILAERFGLPGPSLESIIKCEHKYWSRLEQQKVIPNNIPSFHAFDPFDETAWESIPLVPPYWIKPFKSFRSYLAFEIHDYVEFQAAVERLREGVAFMNEPFRYLLDTFHIGGQFLAMKEDCLAESVIGGSQCTLEGYVYEGEPVIYGVVDSIREAGRSSFARYQYPSRLPQEVQFRMADVAGRAVTQIGLDNCAFNVEFFWDQTANKVWLLEFNPRVSQAHTWMFEQVHGESHLQVMLDRALGRRPKTLEWSGEYALAANFMLRTFEPAYVRGVPGKQEIERLAQAVLGTRVKLRVESGQDLRELQGQDMYSFELANILVGAQTEMELLEKHDQVLAGLDFDLIEAE